MSPIFPFILFFVSLFLVCQFLSFPFFLPFNLFFLKIFNIVVCKVTPCVPADICRRLGAKCFLHLRGGRWNKRDITEWSVIFYQTSRHHIALRMSDVTEILHVRTIHAVQHTQNTTVFSWPYICTSAHSSRNQRQIPQLSFAWRR